MDRKGQYSQHLSTGDLQTITRKTLQHYDENASSFFEGTRHHDVVQNINALLSEISGSPPYRILDFGCGPGRDLIQFMALGHKPVGLDGSPAFVAMARQSSGCEVLLQDFLTLDLPASHFDGVFANASLFHVPKQELSRVLQALWETLEIDGVLFASNPRGDNQEGWSDNRYGCFHDLDQWRDLVVGTGFKELQHYYRPPGKPRDQQPWLATVWRKIDLDK
jgi:SAM-dependent methyltransferase